MTLTPIWWACDFARLAERFPFLIFVFNSHFIEHFGVFKATIGLMLVTCPCLIAGNLSAFCGLSKVRRTRNDMSGERGSDTMSVFAF